MFNGQSNNALGLISLKKRQLKAKQTKDIRKTLYNWTA